MVICLEIGNWKFLSSECHSHEESDGGDEGGGDRGGGLGGVVEGHVGECCVDVGLRGVWCRGNRPQFETVGKKVYAGNRCVRGGSVGYQRRSGDIVGIARRVVDKP